MGLWAQSRGAAAVGDRRHRRYALPGTGHTVSSSGSHVLVLSSGRWGCPKGPETLRDFCVSQSCFVMLRRALGSICNGHPASEVVKNQRLTIDKNPISRVRRASNQVVGGSNPSGRTKINGLDAMFFGAVLLTKFNSTIIFQVGEVIARRTGHHSSGARRTALRWRE